MRRILIVDDEKGIRDFLCKAILKYSGSIVEAVSSVSDAIKKFEKKPYNVLITDINMPGTSGLFLIRYVKKLFPGCMIIAMSTAGSQLEEAEKIGASFCLSKPFTISEVLEKITM
jgi:two-component system response regulator HydG